MPERVSLVWPPGHEPPATSGRPTSWWEDLSFDYLAQALDYERGYGSPVRTILAHLNAEAEVIRYRQEVLADVSGDGNLQEELEALLPLLRELSDVGHLRRDDLDNQFLVVMRRLRQLELYVECVLKLLAALEGATNLGSRGLRLLEEHLAKARQGEEFTSLASELPNLRAAMQKASSVTIGVNLDEQARPVAATLLAVNNHPFSGKRSFLARLLGLGREQVAGEGLAELHVVARDNMNPFMQPLFRDLAEVLRLVCLPVAQALSQYTRINVGTLAALTPEVAFYLGAVRLAARLRAAGLPLCQPRILPAQERTSRVVDLYNINLALRLLQQPPPPGLPKRPIPSDLHMGQEGRSFILTGPNLGGKTTYVEAVGLAHVLAQAGLFVPARAADISPVDAIYTHFPAKEQLANASGRLGEEAQRLADIFSKATPQSLILLNESLSSTSPGECLYLAGDVVRGLRLLGARAIYATHLHELASSLEEVNAIAPSEPPTVSLVAGIDLSERRSGDGSLGRTYRIEPGPPQGKSYAEEIAERHGISLAQLKETLRQRGISAG